MDGDREGGRVQGVRTLGHAQQSALSRPAAEPKNKFAALCLQVGLGKSTKTVRGEKKRNGDQQY